MIVKGVAHFSPFGTLTRRSAQQLISMLLFLLPAVLVAQAQNGEIRGVVVDNRHEPIHTSQLVLRGGGIERTAQSDDTGSYRFMAVPAGEYDLTITAPFFYTSTVRAVRLQGNEVRVLPPLEMVFEGYDCTARVPAYLSPLDRSDMNKGALGGMIVDDHGRALPDAKVTLFVPGAGVTSSTISNHEGRFSVRDISLRRDYRIEVAREGYFTEEFADFKIQAGFEAIYDRLNLEACEPGRCQSSLRPIRILPHCE